VSRTTLADYSYLIVDDDKFIRDLVSLALRKQGISRIAVAEGGQAAIDHIKVGQIPDIIICDLNMPEVDGVEFLQYLAGASFNGGVILISGTNAVIMRAALKLGDVHALDMLGILPKPFTPDDLIQALSKYDKESRISFT
jgi:CheY-like chemotaxis protein